MGNLQELIVVHQLLLVIQQKTEVISANPSVFYNHQ
jgi:hypothetical protein